jgi:hypothetical protein
MVQRLVFLRTPVIEAVSLRATPPDSETSLSRAESDRTGFDEERMDMVREYRGDSTEGGLERLDPRREGQPSRGASDERRTTLTG